MRFTRILTPMLLGLLAGNSTAYAVDRPHYDATYDALATTIGPLDIRAPKHRVSTSKPARTSSSTAALPMVVSSSNVRRDAPVFAWSGRMRVDAPVGVTDPTVAARFYLDKLAPMYHLPDSAVAAAVVKKVHDTGRGGIVVSIGQDIDGVEIFRDRMSLLLQRNLALVAVGGGLHRAASVQTKSVSNRWIVTPQDAVAKSIGDLYAMPVNGASIVEIGKTPGGYSRFDLLPAVPAQTAQYRFSRPARAKKVFFPMPESLVPAYYIEVFAGQVNSRVTDTYAYVIAADDGRVLYRANLTAHVAYGYRVWAETTGNKRPLDAPIEDFTPHPTGMPDGSYPASIPPVLVTMEGFNTTPAGVPDPWLLPTSTETTGNNVDAYSDDESPDGFSPGDIRATPTSKFVFDRVYDTSQDPLVSADQTMAAVTQLFYTVNWMHDSWYDSGFDEAAGNGQVDNYGRGGLGNDPVVAQAQDGALLGYIDNANMSTPADGESPQMQMYLWSGVASGFLSISPGGAMYAPGFASFGPSKFEISGNVVLAQDATAPFNDICSPIVNDVAGKIALIDRGICSFESKVAEAQKAGAIAAIIVNHTAGAPAPDMPGGGIMPPVTIPVLSVTLENGKTIKDSLPGPITATLGRTTSPRPDGTIDNTVVTHEWGHYLHNRLVFCSTNQCGAEGEGWGDFVALTLMVRENDNLDGTYTSSVYAPAAFPNAGYFGDRRYPYSVNLEKNPLTFKYIADGEALPTDIPTNAYGLNNAEVHNAGEVWASMLFEGYVLLLKESKATNPRYTFDEARRRMQDYVVAGMKLAPADPTFTEQRDAILAAALAADEKDAMLLAQGFAKRGAGSCAVSPARESEDNSGVVESFEVTPALSIVSVKLEMGANQCDGDTALDAHETGTLTVEITNTGVVPLGKGELSVASVFPGVQFLGDTTVNLENIAPLSAFTKTFDVRMGGPNEPSVVPFDVKVVSAEMCEPEVEKIARFRVNYDNAAFVSTTESFESDIDVWRRQGTYNDFVWSREADDELNYAWHGKDVGFSTDTRLESPAVDVSATEDFVVSFKHRHSFEASPEMDGGPDVYWDGAVVEISGVNGAKWEDVADFIDPGYNGTILDQPENALANRDGFVSTNPSWPETDTVTLSFGKALAGKQIKLRFRIGSDGYVGDYGWDVDDVAFQGISGTPFPGIVPSQKVCNAAPIANAGDNARATPQMRVSLDASKSSDADGDPLTFTWTQLKGPAVELEDATSKTPAFVTPGFKATTTLTFQIGVSDGFETSVDTVDVIVEASPIVGGGACSMVAPGKTTTWPVVAGAFIGLAAWARQNRRRRNRS
jgi:hypothetical protein